ncbi:MAG: hypothetical protein DK306_000339 [Chloroflexi bacterium]|nr:MAG: hypothetical protein DK306_000339 [Chloroflexota bacterium]
MADRLERDVEDVLEKIEDFEWHRRQRRAPSRARRAWSGFWQQTSDRLGSLFVRFSSGHLMLAGFLLLVAGLVLRARGLGTWFVLAGIILFLIGLAWNMRAPRSGPTPDGRGGFWRDRYIHYDESQPGGVRGWFKRWRR